MYVPCNEKYLSILLIVLIYSYLLLEMDKAMSLECQKNWRCPSGKIYLPLKQSKILSLDYETVSIGTRHLGSYTDTWIVNRNCQVERDKQLFQQPSLSCWSFSLSSPSSPWIFPCPQKFVRTYPRSIQHKQTRMNMKKTFWKYEILK